MKSEGRYLPEIIHDDEHIKGAWYGRYENGSAMLVATDHQVIFLDRMPLFTASDELTISGILPRLYWHFPLSGANRHENSPSLARIAEAIPWL